MFKKSTYETPEWIYNSLKGIFKALLRVTYDVTSFNLEKLDNLPKNKGFIFAANHGSIIDALVMGLEVNSHRVRFLGRYRTLWGNPIFAKLNDIIGTIPVPESKTEKKQSVVVASVNALKENACVGIFPEGAILRHRKKFEGKTGTARMALEAGVPIVPVGLLGTDGLWPYGAKMPRLGRPVQMYVGAPLFFDDYHGMQDDLTSVRYVTDVMMKEIRKESGWWDVPSAKIIELHRYYQNLKSHK